MFDQYDDGSHEITLHKIRRPGSELYPHSSGTLKWNPHGGVCYSLTFDGIFSLAGSTFDTGPKRVVPTVGRLSSADLTQPRWVAETDDGTQVSLYEVMEKSSSTQTRGTSGQGVSCGFQGQAMFAVVDIPVARMLAFDNSTVEDYRLFFIGHAGHVFDDHQDVSFHDADGSIYNSRRCSIRLSESPLVELVAAHSLIKASPGGWLAFGQPPTESDCELGAFAEQSFVSFLNGDKVPFPWADRRISPATIRRTYYGWVKSRQCDRIEPDHQPLPFLGGIEVFTHGEEVLSLLPGFFQRFIICSEAFDFNVALHPLWTALHGVLDDRLALASVSLERTASMWKQCGSRFMSKTAREPSLWRNKPLLKALRRALRERLNAVLGAESRKRRCRCSLVTSLMTCLDAFIASDACRALDGQQRVELRDVLAARINNLTDMPNSAKLRQPFDDLQIPISKAELEAIGQRNQALHGRQGDVPPDTADLDLSTEHFDRLRMLVTKFVLKLGGYEGPYIDYASRPTTGNFEIKRLAT